MGRKLKATDFEKIAVEPAVGLIVFLGHGAEVKIVNSTRSGLGHIINPISSSLNRAFR